MTEEKKSHSRDYRPLLVIGALAGAVVSIIGAAQRDYSIAALGAALCAAAIGVALRLPGSGSSD